jgi:hypothetical protein
MASQMLLPPVTRTEFEERNRRFLAGDPSLTDADVHAWERGRDWLAERLVEERPGLPKRRSPRLRLSLLAHIGGVGAAVTEDLGFFGLGLKSKRQPDLSPGEEASVRISLLGRSIYLLGRVAWAADERVGIAIGAAHPSDERAIQAAVCNGLLERWPQA